MTLHSEFDRLAYYCEECSFSLHLSHWKSVIEHIRPKEQMSLEPFSCFLWYTQNKPYQVFYIRTTRLKCHWKALLN
jgi:hypothetical protein